MRDTGGFARDQPTDEVMAGWYDNGHETWRGCQGAAEGQDSGKDIAECESWETDCKRMCLRWVDKWRRHRGKRKNISYPSEPANALQNAHQDPDDMQGMIRHELEPVQKLLNINEPSYHWMIYVIKSEVRKRTSQILRARWAQWQTCPREPMKCYFQPISMKSECGEVQ